jgi:hypothetical protein
VTALQFRAPAGQFSVVFGSRSYAVASPGEVAVSE